MSSNNLGYKSYKMKLSGDKKELLQLITSHGRAERISQWSQKYIITETEMIMLMVNGREMKMKLNIETLSLVLIRTVALDTT